MWQVHAGLCKPTIFEGWRGGVIVGMTGIVLIGMWGIALPGFHV